MSDKAADTRFVAESDEWMLRELGLIDPDQPSSVAHHDRIRRLEAPFTPLERRLIRCAVLGDD